MKGVVRFLLYHNNFISKAIYRFLYRDWLLRYQSKDGFVFAHNIRDHIPEENIFSYHDKETVRFKSPNSINDLVLPDLMSFYVNKNVFKLPKGVVYLFSEAYLLGNEAVGVTPKGAIISDTALDEPVVLHKCNPKLIQNFASYANDSEEEWCCSLVNIFCSNTYTNYFHWIMDSMILIQGVRYLEQKTGRKIKLIINKNRPKYQDDYLSFLGYHSDDLIEWNYTKLKVNNLVVVQSRRVGVNRDEVMSPNGIMWLKKQLVPYASKNTFGDRIYITRKNTFCRKVLNEPELLPLLKRKGFVVVDLDILSVADQISLFSNAKIVISPHGAGLANIIFGDKLKVIELIGNIDVEDDYYWYAAYYSLCNVLNFDYSYLRCESEPLENQKYKLKQLYDLKVDVKSLEQILDS